MRPRVPGMNELDDSILEFFADLDEPEGERVALPPTAVWFNVSKIRGTTEKKQNTFSYRMNRLAKRGLLEKSDGGRGYYFLTENGRRYLEGDIDSSELEIEEEES